MSKLLPPILLVFAAIIQILQFVNNSSGQDAGARIKIALKASGKAEVSGSFANGTRPNPRNLSFLNQYAGITGLGERISDLSLFDPNGKPVANKRFMSGEYVADDDFSLWAYAVSLKPFGNASAAAHTSWMNEDLGILMGRDILPQLSGDSNQGTIRFTLPIDWKAFSSLDGSANGVIKTPDVDSAVIFVGRNWREKDGETAGLHFTTLISGGWQFSDDDASRLSSEIIDEYKKVFGGIPFGRVQIAIAKFPVDVSVNNWEADTRGNTITILSSDTPFKSQSIQRLHEQLRHEIFHLWIPNGVNLSGNYDWFYEGFALYQSLKLGVGVNRIRFDDFLDTLSRAYEIDKATASNLSLIKASQDRWNGSNTQIYARGMLVAFLCDLALLENSKGKRSVTDLMSEFYKLHRPPALRRDGNEAVLSLLRSHSELNGIIDRNITGTETIDWGGLLKGAGLQVSAASPITKLEVVSDLTGRQKDLLNRLGYNNWRKVAKGNK